MINADITTNGSREAEPLASETLSKNDYWALNPDTSLLHRSLHDRPHVALSASKHTITLQDGRQILDACGGAAVVNIGHGNQEVLDAIVAQAKSLSFVHSMTYTTPVAEELGKFILEGNPGGLSKAYFVSSGSEATDTAMKLSRQYFFERGQHQRTHFITRKQGYHGNTVGAMSLSSNLARLVPYQPILLPNVSHVSPCYPYQYQHEGESEVEYVDRLAKELEAEFQSVGPDKVIAFVMEPVVGATSGCNGTVPGYLAAVKNICQRHGALLILDEIMCGMGRVGTDFAWQYDGVSPDMLMVAKGLGGGYASIAGLLVAKHIIDSLEAGTGIFVHGFTYQAHPLACAAAFAVQKIVRRENLVSRCKEMGEVLQKTLQQELDHELYVGNIRGRGLFYGVEFVKDKKTRESFDPNLKFGLRVQQRTMDLGVAIYPGSGTVDGKVGDHVIIAPPYTITVEEIELIVKTLHTAYLDIVEELTDTFQ